jgi:hypothetical protein
MELSLQVFQVAFWNDEGCRGLCDRISKFPFYV